MVNTQIQDVGNITDDNIAVFVNLNIFLAIYTYIDKSVYPFDNSR